MTRSILPTLLTSAVLVLAPVHLAAQANNCIPPTGRASPVGPLDALRGSLLVIVYGSTGAGKGRIASGTVDLELAGADMKTRGVVLVGASTIDLSRVGASFAGSLRSRDPAAPGVTVEGPAGGRGATLTFGSVRARNAAGALAVPVTRFELREKSLKGYRGTWETIGGSGPKASGYFCASRF